MTTSIEALESETAVVAKQRLELAKTYDQLFACVIHKLGWADWQELADWTSDVDRNRVAISEAAPDLEPTALDRLSEERQI